MIDGMKYNVVSHKKAVLSEIRSHIAASLLGEELLEEIDEIIASYETEQEAIAIGKPEKKELLDPSHDNLTSYQKMALQKHFYGYPDHVVEHCDKKSGLLHDQLVDADKRAEYGHPIPDEIYYAYLTELADVTIVRNAIKKF